MKPINKYREAARGLVYEPYDEDRITRFLVDSFPEIISEKDLRTVKKIVQYYCSRPYPSARWSEFSIKIKKALKL
jgi:hypothetical protein